MDDYTGKRAPAGLGFSRRGSSLAFREPNHDGRNNQYCKRLGCSTRLNPPTGTQSTNPEKPKYPKPSVRSNSSKAVAGSSSKPVSPTNLRKPPHEQHNRPSLRQTLVAEGSSRQGEIEHSESSSQHEGSTEGMEDLESPTLQDLSTISSESSGSRPGKRVNGRLRTSNQDTSNSSLQRPIASRSTSQAPKPGVQRYGLKNLSCTAISDVLPSGCSPSSDLGHNRRAVSVRKRPSDDEGAMAAGKSTSGSSSGSQVHQQVSRRPRNRPISRDGPVSVRTRRAPVGETRMRLAEEVGDNIDSLSEPIMYPRRPQAQLSISDSIPESSSTSSSIELPPVYHSSFSARPGSSGRSARSRLGSHTEESSNQIFHGNLGDREGYRRFNMDGIAEVLFALERIEQDEELTYEQLLVLETNLLLGGLSFHDQHRDMRLDIDNMSYEELLALEEKMGNVSTALSEEALSKCLKRTNYAPASQFPGITTRGDDDIKCSICQEEYASGEEVGKLTCDHRYHVDCIHQWLRQKNWCPICKSSASLS